MVWLDRVPARAAVHESVEIAKQSFPSWTAGFVNASLRSVARAIGMKVGGRLSPEDLRRAVPISGDRNCMLAGPVFPDPGEDATASLSLRYGYPNWLVDRHRSRFGDEIAEAILNAGNEPPRPWLRPSPDRTEDIARELRSRKVPFEVHDQPVSGIRLLSPAGLVGDLPGYRRGWFVVQDRTAMKAAPLLAPEAGHRILDLCAAPGGKTCQLAQLVGPETAVVAVDRSADRLDRLEENRRRLGITNISIVIGDACDPDLDLGEPYDRILVDVPCSNTGVLAKRAEARHRISPERVDELVRLQSGILVAAAKRLAPGGAIVYSTCALLDEENRAQVDGLLAADPALVLEKDAETLPVAGFADGGYAARISSPG